MSAKIPLELAQCARDKLQASASVIWSSIRSFDETNNNNTSSKQQQSSNDESDSTPQTTTAENTAAMSLEKIENVLKVMFGSCTAGMPQRNPSSAEPAPTTVPCERRSRSRDFVANKDMGEHVYEQLFMDDQARATRAVEGLRAKSSSTPTSKSPSPQFSSYFGAPLASTPIGHNVPVAAAPLTTKAIDVSGDFDFDDGISAISNHTLEEMARVHEHRQSLSPTKRTTSSSKSRGGAIVENISYPLPSRSRQRAPTTPRSPPVHPMPSSIMAPVKFSRGPSHGTAGTKSSKGTKSTSSTHDSHSEFASVWRKEEAKYWDDVVEKEKKSSNSFAMSASRRSATKSRRRSRCGSHSVRTRCSVSRFANCDG